jgi:hypothetical protein
MAMATRKPTTYHCPATRWSLDDLVAALQQPRREPLRRSSLWRMLEAVDRKPQRSVSGLNSHAPDGEAQAQAICALYLNARRFYAHDRIVIGTDEQTGRQSLPRTSPTQPLGPGKPEQREHEYSRPGGRALIASFVVPPGHVGWHVGEPRPSADLAAPLAHVVTPRPAMRRYDWVVDKLHTPWSLEVCRLVAQGCHVPSVANARRRGVQRRAFLSDPSHRHVVPCTPKHGAWLNQVELWLSGLARRFLQRGDVASAHDFATRLADSLEVSNTQDAHPYRWTYTGQPLVRATPFSHTRRQPRHGRAWVSSRPKRFARAFYPPRPYKRAAA